MTNLDSFDESFIKENNLNEEEKIIIQFLSDRIKNIQEGSKLLFTDLDGTIYRDSLYLNIYKKLCDDKIFSDNAKKIYDENRKLWKNRKIGYDDFLKETLEMYLNEANKIPVDYISKVTDRVMEDNFDKRYISVSGIITKYKESGYKVIVISGSMDEIVLKFVNYMNFDSGIGTVEFKGKEFLTGKRIVLAKNSTKKLVIDYILKKIKPEHTIGLGDTIGDLGLLRSVNYGIAVNPSRELYHEIKDDSNIKVLIERKDLSFFAEKIDLNFLDNLVL